MFKRFKNWLLNKFLPVWAKETLKKDNDMLLAKNIELEHKIAEQQSYIEGLEFAIRHNKIIIKGDVKQ